jgi:ATP-dependent DNA ligase
MKTSKSGTALDIDVPGYALRFPRLERFRDDKRAEDATTVKEVEKLFKSQTH